MKPTSAGAPSRCPGLAAKRRPAAHPCKRAHDALTAAGYQPEVVRSYGLASLPDFTRARKEVKRLTGESFVPVLVLDDGEVIAGSDRIVAWASAR
jgi:glutaredoxin